MRNPTGQSNQREHEESEEFMALSSAAFGRLNAAGPAPDLHP